jgi:hypothetical protein
MGFLDVLAEWYFDFRLKRYFRSVAEHGVKRWSLEESRLIRVHEMIKCRWTFLDLRRTAYTIVLRVDDASSGNSPALVVRAMKEATEQLPPILEAMRGLPAYPELGTRWLKAKGDFVRGVEVYLSGCEHGIRWLETGDETEAKRTVAEIKEAKTLMGRSSFMEGM